MTDPRQNDIEIEPLSDEALEEVAGGNSLADRSVAGLGSDGPSCCSDSNCSNG